LKHFAASDISAEAVRYTAKKLQGIREDRFSVGRIGLEDIAAAGDLPGGDAEQAFDAIITDPPWGMYEETAKPLQEFYNDMLQIFAKILRPGGTAVILTAKTLELAKSIAGSKTFKINTSFPILLSGKKAEIFRLIN
jgi:tRNA G10  N-methylase Trm11